jgi:uncharacterized protein YwbE
MRDQLTRYYPAARRYLLAIFRGDEDAADSALEAFVVRFSQGKFDKAQRGNGSFRAYLKKSLWHLSKDELRRRKEMSALQDDIEDEREEPEQELHQREQWCKGLEEVVFERLKAEDARLELAIRLRRENEKGKREEIVAKMSQQVGEEVTQGQFSQLLTKGRKRARGLFLDAVIDSFGNTPTREQLFEELAELGCLAQMREELQQRGLG